MKTTLLLIAMLSLASLASAETWMEYTERRKIEIEQEENSKHEKYCDDKKKEIDRAISVMQKQFKLWQDNLDSLEVLIIVTQHAHELAYDGYNECGGKFSNVWQWIYNFKEVLRKEIK